MLAGIPQDNVGIVPPTVATVLGRQKLLEHLWGWSGLGSDKPGVRLDHVTILASPALLQRKKEHGLKVAEFVRRKPTQQKTTETSFTLTPSGPGVPPSPSRPGSPCKTDRQTKRLRAMSSTIPFATSTLQSRSDLPLQQHELNVECFQC